MSNEIVLWAGSKGVKLDKNGNIFDIEKDNENNLKNITINEHQLLISMINMYQQILKDNGFDISIKEEKDMTDFYNDTSIIYCNIKKEKLYDHNDHYDYYDYRDHYDKTFCYKKINDKRKRYV